MKFLTYTYDNKETIGVLSNDSLRILNLSNILSLDRTLTMNQFIEEYKEEYTTKIRKALEETTERGIELTKVKIQSPIPYPKRGIICIGKNYKEHVKEVPSTMDLKSGIPEAPVYFSKFVNKTVATNEAIQIHDDITNQLDYEVELGVIIGKEGTNIPIDKVEDYIFGYTIINDVSSRDLQARNVQWLKGKSLDGACPMGPYLVHKSSIEFPVQLNIKNYINDKLRQSSNTKEMIFNISYIISDFSKGITLKPGDIISTGTPAGVGMGLTPPTFLRKHDKITCEIEKIGKLENVVL